VKPGDEVAEDQPLVEVMTDKATVTIPSPKRGRVTRLFWKEGDLAKVHAPLLEMEVEAGATAGGGPRAAPAPSPGDPDPGPAPTSIPRSAATRPWPRPPPAARPWPPPRSGPRRARWAWTSTPWPAPAREAASPGRTWRAAGPRRATAAGAGPGRRRQWLRAPRRPVPPAVPSPPRNASRSGGCGAASSRRWRCRSAPPPTSPSSSRPTSASSCP
jgi:pyruvate/2-oxoglutarate dehydrogenase complex dihydrolipoamide acyltransferase (E2) component